MIESPMLFGRRILSTDYSVIARLRNGNEIPILFDIETKDQAVAYMRQIEQAIIQFRQGEGVIYLGSIGWKWIKTDKLFLYQKDLIRFYPTLSD